MNEIDIDKLIAQNALENNQKLIPTVESTTPIPLPRYLEEEALGINPNKKLFVVIPEDNITKSEIQDIEPVESPKRDKNITNLVELKAVLSNKDAAAILEQYNLKEFKLTPVYRLSAFARFWIKFYHFFINRKKDN